MKNGRVTLGNTEMDYVSFGHGKRNLIVLPGLSDGLATVKGKALLLAPPYRNHLRSFTVYLFSRKNEMPEGYSIRDMAEDQARAMDLLGIGQADVLGVSQGGMIAMSLAADHPERVNRLILAVTAPYCNDVAREAVTGWIGMAERGDHCALMADTAEKTYSERYLRKYRKMVPLLARWTRPADYGRFFRNARAILSFDAREDLSRIRCPVLILAGSEDRTVGTEAARELRALIPGSELYVYEGLGHGVFEEAKDFYDRVFAFCGNGIPPA